MSESVLIAVIGSVCTLFGVFLSFAGSKKASENSKAEAEDRFNLDSVTAASEEWRNLYREQSESISKLRAEMNELSSELKETKQRLEGLERSRDAYRVIAERLLSFVEWLNALDPLDQHDGEAPEPVAALISESKKILSEKDWGK